MPAKKVPRPTLNDIGHARALSQLVALLQLLDEGPQPVVGRELYLSYVRGLLVKRRVGLGC